MQRDAQNAQAERTMWGSKNYERGRFYKYLSSV